MAAPTRSLQCVSSPISPSHSRRYRSCSGDSTHASLPHACSLSPCGSCRSASNRLSFRRNAVPSPRTHQAVCLQRLLTRRRHMRAQPQTPATTLRVHHLCSLLPSALPRTAPPAALPLARGARACPRCHALVHAQKIDALSTQAQKREASGDIAGARALWSEA